ncbi:hypothetical protein DIPPA_21733 [Diplonema papillatum]|nr:hypothetical protein DIPPA_21733 [Diplonema papillatum]
MRVNVWVAVATAIACAAAGSKKEKVCLLAYESSSCAGKGVMQGYVNGSRYFQTNTEACNIGVPFGRFGQGGQCDERVCSDLPSACSASTCLAKECVLYSWCWKDTKACSKQPTTIQTLSLDVKVSNQAQAIEQCGYAGRAGNGFRVPVTGSLAKIDVDGLASNIGLIIGDGIRQYMVDGRRDAKTQQWLDSDGGVLAIGVQWWAPGHPKQGNTLLGVVYDKSKQDALFISLEDGHADSSVLCFFGEASVIPPTPAPTEPVAGACAYDEWEEGTWLEACGDDDCASYSSEHAAKTACCDMGGACLGVIEEASGQSSKYLVGVSNRTTALSSGKTYRRTWASFVTPPPPVMHGGIPLGLLLILGLVVLMTFYCTIGMALKIQAGAEGCPDVLPNDTFWTALPAAIGNCCASV